MLNEETEKILKKLKRLERFLQASNEQPMCMAKAEQYTGLSRSHLYKLTSSRLIPHYKPQGKMIFFRKDELDHYLLSNKVATMEEIEAKSNVIFSKLPR